MNKNLICPSCSSLQIEPLYEIHRVPVHSVLLHKTRAEAIQYPTGDIWLGLCRSCGFIYNAAFDPAVHEYSAQYEATQGYSETFNTFHKHLAQTLIDRYALTGKKIIEIGCGQGEFLALLCELGNNQGIGFDPAFVPERSPAAHSANAWFVSDFYSQKYQEIQGDFICCKMTLEHIQQTGDFIRMVRRSLNQDRSSKVFFQIPNARYVLREAAFWDIYYEHCSYFSQGSLASLFKRAGFEVLDLWTDYDDQYLMITAQVEIERSFINHPGENNLDEFAGDVAAFKEKVSEKIQAWKDRLMHAAQQEQRVVLWGGGSKAVSFLTTLGISCERLPYVVDINPHKRGTFLAGTGQEVIAPQQLLTYAPQLVIVMNPVYVSEIQQTLAGMGLAPELLSVESY